jgi:rare lipoprotein A (peptidoglycan hydrolase)
MTCASNKFPFGTLLRVFYGEKHIDVRVNDRMKKNQKATIDLSREAFKAICPLDSGIIKVKIQIIRR